MKTTRNTKVKRVITELINSSKEALSHMDVESRIGPICNRVTIYRVLARLVEEGVIHKVMDVDGVAKYAACRQCDSHEHHHNHVHFSCTSCQSVQCLDEARLSYFIPKRYVVKEANFMVSGLCSSCS